MQMDCESKQSTETLFQLRHWILSDLFSSPILHKHLIQLHWISPLFSLRSRQAILFSFPFVGLQSLLQVLLAGKFTLVPTCKTIHSSYTGTTTFDMQSAGAEVEVVMFGSIRRAAVAGSSVAGSRLPPVSPLSVQWEARKPVSSHTDISTGHVPETFPTFPPGTQYSFPQKTKQRQTIPINSLDKLTTATHPKRSHPLSDSSIQHSLQINFRLKEQH